MNATEQWADQDNAETSAARSSIDVVGLLFRRKWVIVFGVAVGLALGYLYYSKAKPVYESIAQVLIIKRSAPAPFASFGNEQVNVRETLDTHVVVLKSVEIVHRAVVEHDLKDLPSFRGVDPGVAIMEGLNVENAGGDIAPHALVLQITFDGPNPRDCKLVLDALVASYEKFLRENYQSVSAEVVKLITDARDQLNTDLTKLNADYAEFRVNSPLVIGEDGKARNPHQDAIAVIDKRRLDIKTEKFNKQALQKAVSNALTREVSKDVIAMLIETGGPREEKGSSPFLADMLAMEAEVETLKDRYGPDHPEVRKIETKMRKMRIMTNSTGQPLDDRRNRQEETTAVVVSRFQLMLVEQLLAMEDEDQTLAAERVKENDSARALALFQVKDENFRREIARRTELFETTMKHLQEISMAKDYGGPRTEVVSPAGLGWQVEPNLGRIMTIAGVLGAMFGMGLAYLVEMADKSFRSPEEIRKQLGLPVIGHIPVLAIEDAEDLAASNVEGAKVDPIVLAYHRPKSRMSEAYRAVRTSLYFATRGGRQKVIQITSPDPGDGKTTLAANLAASIAQSGKRIVLIDTDFRRPRAHRIFDVGNEIGMSSVLMDGTPLMEACHPTVVENLWVMPTGPKPNNPAELLTSPNFDQLIAEARAQFDFVLLDTPPLLAVTDPCVVAPRVDGVIITIRITKKSRPNALRAREALAALGANVLGIVVNGVGRRPNYGSPTYAGKSGGYYGGESYAYESYGYGYGYETYQPYYADDDAGASKAKANGAASKPSDANRRT